MKQMKLSKVNNGSTRTKATRLPYKLSIRVFGTVFLHSYKKSFVVHLFQFPNSHLSLFAPKISSNFVSWAHFGCLRAP